MRWLRDLGLGVKLSLLLVLVLGILLLFTILLLNSNTQTLTQEVGAERVAEEVNIIQRRLAEVERELAVDLDFMVSSTTFFQAVGRRNQDDVTEIVAQAKDRLGLDDIDVVDGDGQSLADIGLVGDEVEVHGLLEQALAGDDNVAVLVETDEGGIRVRMMAVAPVVSATGNVLGAMQISRVMDSSFLSELLFDRDGIYTGLIHDQRILTRSTNVTGTPAAANLLTGIEFDPEAVQGAGQGQVVYADNLVVSSDSPHSIAYIPVSVGAQPSAVVMMISVELDELHAFQNTTLVNTSLIFALLAVLMIGVIYAVLYRVAIRPINNLRTIAQKMTSGQYDQRIPISGGDELGQLASTFNEMADAVQQREISLQAAREQAERSDQVKSAFLASMSHELRTPLNAVINFTHFVMDGDTGPVNDEQVELLTEVVNSGKHLLRLINDVLDMSKIEAGSLKLFVEDNISLNSILNSVMMTGQGLLAGKSVQIESEIDPTLPLIRGDAQRLLQIFLNIMSNACKFTEQGSIKVSARCQDNTIVVAIRDSGPGIAPEDQALVFEPFKQTHTGLQRGGGTGLGMPIARSLAEAHGGKLWLTSAPNAGATFYVSLPIHAEMLMPTLVM